jgi:hypothetical protein
MENKYGFTSSKDYTINKTHVKKFVKKSKRPTSKTHYN